MSDTITYNNKQYKLSSTTSTYFKQSTDIDPYITNTPWYVDSSVIFTDDLTVSNELITLSQQYPTLHFIVGDYGLFPSQFVKAVLNGQIVNLSTLLNSLNILPQYPILYAFIIPEPLLISLSKPDVSENQPDGTVVGQLSTYTKNEYKVIIKVSNQTDTSGSLVFYIDENLIQPISVKAIQTGMQDYTTLVYDSLNTKTWSSTISFVSTNTITLVIEFPIFIQSQYYTLTNISVGETGYANKTVRVYPNSPYSGSVTYSLPQNNNFDISGSNLLTKRSFDYEADPSFNIVITSDIGAFTTIDQTFNIIVNDVYEAPSTYTLTYSAGTGGSVIGTTTQTVNENTSGTGVTAVANAGYVFSQWSDGATGAYRVDSIVNQNKGFTASFSVLSVSIQGNSLTSVVSLPSGTSFQFTDPQVNLTQESQIFYANSGSLALGVTGASGPQVVINNASSSVKYIFSSVSDSTKNGLGLTGDTAFILKVIDNQGILQTTVSIPLQLYLDSNVGTTIDLIIPGSPSIAAGSGTYGGQVGSKYLYNCTLTRGDGIVVGSGSTPAPSAGSDPHVTTIFGKKYDFHPSTRKNYTLFKSNDMNVSSHFSGLKSGVYYDTVKIDLPNKDCIKVDFNKHKIRGSSSLVSISDAIPDVKYKNNTSDKSFGKMMNPKMMKKVSIQGKNPVDMYVDFGTRYVHLRFPDTLPAPSEMSGLIVEPATRMNL